MRNLICILIFCLSFFTTQYTIAQERAISCKVVVFDSIALVGAVVQIKSSRQTFLTDSQGMCEVIVQPNDRLTISASGFQNQKLKIERNQREILVNLALKPGDRNKDLVLQHGHVSNPSRFLNARKLYNDKRLDFSQYATFFELIKGRFPNVEVTANEIIIRGVKSIHTSSGALIVLNGVLSNFSVLSSLVPATIESVEIVTGTPAMIYGPGAGNGVLLIETKGFEN